MRSRLSVIGLDGATFRLIGPWVNEGKLPVLGKLMEEGKLKSASLNNVAYAFQQVMNARRLESGQSTSNIGISIEQRLAKATTKSAEYDSKD